RDFHVTGVQTCALPIFFRRSDVIAAGGVFSTESYPVIDLEAGGSLEGIIDALDTIVDLIIPVYGQDGGTLVIPGHGRISNLGDEIGRASCRERVYGSRV